MASPYYMTLKGKASGDIKGSCNELSHKDEIKCLAFKHLMDRPTNLESGEPSGLRRHREFVVTKEFDASSPLLASALCNGESVDVVTKWFRTTPEGKEEHYYTITLKNATIIRIEPYVHHVYDERFTMYGHMEDISFTYGRIEWEWAPSNIKKHDDVKK